MTSDAESRPDLVDPAMWARVEAHYRAVMGGPGPSEPREPAISGSGTSVACTVTIRADLETPPSSAVLVVESGATRLVDHGDGVRLPRFAPHADTLAVVVGDRVALVVPDRSPEFLPDPGGVVEHLAWSPDGGRLLAVVAEHGADAAGAQGSGRLATDRPAWAPHVMADAPLGGWRRAAVLRLGEERWRTVSPPATTTWEAAWCGADRVVAVQSARPDEAAWFAAAVVVLDVGGDRDPMEVARPTGGRCIGLPTGDRRGDRIAVVTATCSDRTVVAGDVMIVDLDAGADPSGRVLDLHGVDATWIGWCDGDVLAFAGQRGVETVVGAIDVTTGAVVEYWCSETSTCGQRYPEIAFGDGVAALVLEGFGSPPELAVLRGPTMEVVTRLAHDSMSAVASLGELDIVRWMSPDGLEIEGLLVTPEGAGPHPMVTYVHGGPVWAWRSRWSMGYPYTLALLAAGFAVFHPNPRGSAGRGEVFRSAVIGDLGGAESMDILSGIDHLVASGVADPERLGVFGGSHGGFVAEHLVTVDRRFAAAVAYCPVSHWPTMRLTTNDVAAQDRLIGSGAPSPLDRVNEVTTPTFVSTGSRDLITPASQGLMFHRALALRGVPTEYVEYPLEGHGVRSFPAQIDFTARLLGWFERWMGPGS
jgi:dipeptidyl aminopeptidase/acylaminoacyl peptidase